MSEPSQEIIDHVLKNIPAAIEIGHARYAHLPLGHTLQIPLVPPLNVLSCEDADLVYPLRSFLSVVLIRTADEAMYRFTGQFQETFLLADGSIESIDHDLKEIDDWPDQLDGANP